MKKTVLLLFALSISLFARDYFQQHVDYRIQVSLNPQEKTYQGEEAIKYTNNSPDTLSFIWMHLYPNAYKNNSTPYAMQKERDGNSTFYFSRDKDRGYLDLSSLKSSGEDLSYSFKEDAIDEIKIQLNSPLNPGDTLELELSFIGKFPRVFSRMGVFKKDHFAVTQWYPKIVVYDRYGWHPDSYLDQGEFYGDFGHFDVSVTLPATFVIDATGMLQPNAEEEKFNAERIALAKNLISLENEKERLKLIKKYSRDFRNQVNYDSLKTVRFIADNVHDFAWFAGPEYIMLRMIQQDNVLTNVLLFPENAYDWRSVPEYVRKTLSFYGDQVGPYQYPKASVVDGALTAGGGMEYPMITIISTPYMDWARLLELTVMHEVGHNWFMGMLGSDERASAFMDEGMNSFLEFKYLEHYYGPNNISQFKNLTWGRELIKDKGEMYLMHLTYGMMLNARVDQPLNLRAEEFGRNNYGAVNYQKSIALLRALEWYLKPDVFAAGMHTYFEQWNGKHPGVDDFFATMSDVSGKDLSWFFNEWYNSVHHNDFTINKISSQQKGGFVTTQVWIKNKGNMQGMGAPLSLITASGDTLHKRWEGNEQEAVTFNSPTAAKSVQVNMNRKIFESNYLNNRSGLPKIDLHFIPQLPSYETYQINFFPSYWYDRKNDKSRLGILTWTGNPITQQWFGVGNYSYGLATGKSHYHYKISNRFYFPFSNYTDITAAIRDQEGLKRYSLEISNFYKKRTAIKRKSQLGFAFDIIKLYDLDYNNPNFYQQADYSTLTMAVHSSDKKMLSSWEIALQGEKSLSIISNDFDYYKISLEGRFKYKFGRGSFTSLHFYSGYLSSGSAPLQESIFAAGTLDPKQKSFALLRSGRMAPLHNFSFDRGMTMYGYNSAGNDFFRGRVGSALSLDLRFPYFPRVYIAGASLANSGKGFLKQNTLFAESGLKLDANGITLIFPLYLSDPVPGEKHFAFRWLLSWSFGFSLGV